MNTAILLFADLIPILIIDRSHILSKKVQDKSFSSGFIWFHRHRFLEVRHVCYYLIFKFVLHSTLINGPQGLSAPLIHSNFSTLFDKGYTNFGKSISSSFSKSAGSEHYLLSHINEPLC